MSIPRDVVSVEIWTSLLVVGLLSSSTIVETVSLTLFTISLGVVDMGVGLTLSGIDVLAFIAIFLSVEEVVVVELIAGVSNTVLLNRLTSVFGDDGNNVPRKGTFD